MTLRVEHTGDTPNPKQKKRRNNGDLLDTPNVSVFIPLRYARYFFLDPTILFLVRLPSNFDTSELSRFALGNGMHFRRKIKISMILETKFQIFGKWVSSIFADFFKFVQNWELGYQNFEIKSSFLKSS